MVEERSLKVLSNDTTFFSKVSNTLTKLLTPTKIGINGMMINIKRSAAINFLVSDDRKKLLIPFGALDSLGESIANSIVSARESSKFTSKQDVLSRTKMNSTQFEKMNSMGAFGDLPENDQIGLF